MAFDLIAALEAKPGLITVKEVAEVFSISVRCVERQVASRKIPSFLIGGHRKFDPSQLIRWVTKKNPRIRETQPDLNSQPSL